jgi:hypothetical protein
MYRITFDSKEARKKSNLKLQMSLFASTIPISVLHCGGKKIGWKTRFVPVMINIMGVVILVPVPVPVFQECTELYLSLEKLCGSKVAALCAISHNNPPDI